MHSDAPNSGNLAAGASPAGDHTHWKTENRKVWNEQQHTDEERELVYEISWIAELSAWRRFLRSSKVSKIE
jgi:hypothetical protein